MKYNKKSASINIKGELINFSHPKVMGILNITPDSFYKGCRVTNEEQIINRIKEIINQGADFIDIGAYSSRPGAEDVSEKEEMNRLHKVLTLIKDYFPKTIISVDTFRSQIAHECVTNYGVAMINDISGGELDKKMFTTIADLQVPYILMHMQGTPQTMQKCPNYLNIRKDLLLYFSKKIEQLRALKINDIILDPGFGFGKTLDHNYEIMSNLKDFQIFDLPLLIGISRKSMIYNFLKTTPDGSLNGTTILHTYSLMNGAKILRVHDVKEAVEAIKITEKLKQNLNQHKNDI